jgi:hypothetical protein
LIVTGIVRHGSSLFDVDRDKEEFRLLRRFSILSRDGFVGKKVNGLDLGDKDNQATLDVTPLSGRLELWGFLCLIDQASTAQPRQVPSNIQSFNGEPSSSRLNSPLPLPNPSRRLKKLSVAVWAFGSPLCLPMIEPIL